MRVRLTNLGVDVGNSGDHTGAADRQGRYEPVTLASDGTEVLGAELRLDAGHLGNATTRQLDANDVGVLAQSLQHLRVHVKSSGDTREVVDQDGNRAGICEL